MPVVKRKLSGDGNVEKVETRESVVKESGERRQSFNIRRKPLSVERTNRFDRPSAESERSSSIAPSETSSLTLSLSSKSSSSTSAQPTTLPPTPPRTPPAPPPRNVARNRCPAPVPGQPPTECSYKPPKREPSPPSPSVIVFRVGGFNTTKPPQGVVAATVVDAPRKLVSELPTAQSAPMTRPTGRRRTSMPPVSPISPSGRYVAELDFGRGLRSPASVAAQSRPQIPPIVPTKQPSQWFSLPSPPRSTHTATPIPARYRQSSQSGLEPVIEPLTARRRSSLVNEVPLSKQDALSPMSPVVQPLTRASPDPDYRGGYESNEDTPPLKPNRDPATWEKLTFPSIQPPKSPRVDRPTLPRISTDLSPIAPLRITRIPTETEPSPVKEPKRVVTQSDELTDILDFYLDYVVADATARGVMSSELEKFLSSPDSEDIPRESVIAVPNDRMQGKEVRSVSIVRRALRC